MQNAKKRTVLLLGAGAVLEFGAPSTYELTELLLKDEKVGEINREIESLLRERKIYNEINFESIIHFLDSLVNYLRSNFKSGFKDIYKAFTKIECEVLEEKLKQVDELEFLESGDHFTDKTYLRVVKLLFYNYYHVLMPQLTFYCDQPFIYKDKFELLKNWYLNKSKLALIRTYTTNYDRIIPNLLEGEVTLFDGFQEQKEHLRAKPDISGILTKTEVSNCFNLHGSLFWNVSFASKLRQWRSDKTEVAGANSFSKEFSTSEPNHSNFLIPIITGYAKVRKTQVAPIREFFYAFEKDILQAERIIVVGYSFADDHINNIMSTALDYNKELKVEIIDFDKNGDQTIIQEKVRSSIQSVKSENLTYYMNGFLEYMKSAYLKD